MQRVIEVNEATNADFPFWAGNFRTCPDKSAKSVHDIRLHYPIKQIPPLCWVRIPDAPYQLLTADKHCVEYYHKRNSVLFEMGQSTNAQPSQPPGNMSNQIYKETDFYTKFNCNPEKTNVVFVNIEGVSDSSETECPTQNHKVRNILAVFLVFSKLFVILLSFWGCRASLTDGTGKKNSW